MAKNKNQNKFDNQKDETKTTMDYLSDISAWVLGGAMFLYLGYRTLNFLSYTLSDADQIYKYLGWFSTTIGAIIFAFIFSRSFYFDRKAQVWRSDEFRRAVSGTMMLICALGEFILAAADMSLESSKKLGVVTMTEGEINTIIYLTAGLAFLVGVAVAVIKMTPRHPQTDPIIDMSKDDTDNNGVIDSKEQYQAPRQMVNANAADTTRPEIKQAERPNQQGGAEN